MVNERFHSIFPHERKRRALFNVPASAIKLISGNLHQEDTENYNKAIKALQFNENNMIKKTNRRISLSTKLIDNFNKTTVLLTIKILYYKKSKKLTMIYQIYIRLLYLS